MTKPDRTTALIDPLAGQLGYELRRAAAAMMTAFGGELEPLGLRPSEASMLVLIGSNPGRTQSDLGRALRIKPANMVPIINRLVMSGAVRREPGEGRSLAIFLTDDGKAIYRQVRKKLLRHERRFSRRLSRDARRRLIDALRSICSEACRGLDF